MIESSELSQRLVTDPRVGFFSFIGSAAVGWSCARSWRPACAARWSMAVPRR